nr:MAG TPA: tail tube protein [Caudoviricetes sp.]
MKEKEKIINCGGKEYKLVFNLNVMQEIQNEYGTLEKWGDLTDGFVYDENGEKIPMKDKNNQVITKSVNDANGNITQKVVYKTKEINIKALIFGIRLMINEAIDIENETAEIKKAYLNDKQVGRIVTEIGIYNATSELNQVVIDSTKSDNQKNE